MISAQRDTDKWVKMVAKAATWPTFGSHFGFFKCLQHYPHLTHTNWDFWATQSKDFSCKRYS